MANAVIVRGLLETQQALNIAGIKFHALKVEVLRKFGQKVREVAKDNVPYDTGALRESIYEQLLLESIMLTVELIGAGHPDISRGVGKFKISTVTGNKVSEVPTERYAHVVEANEKYMQTAFDWANDNIDKTIRSLLNASFRGF